MNEHRAVILVGDVRQRLAEIPDNTIQCVVTSPPYWGLRDYGTDTQIGLEESPEEYVAQMVTVFAEIRRILRPDGVLWLNLGDSYAGNNSRASNNGRAGFGTEREGVFTKTGEGLKPKDLVGIPWRVALALQQDGWYLRQDIIWDKPNPMPESVTDRCTKAHEYIFLLTKSPRYFFDNEAIREPAQNWGTRDRTNMRGGTTDPLLKHHGLTGKPDEENPTRNKRSVWKVATRPFKGAHFAVMPESLVEPCVLAGTSEHGACANCLTPYTRYDNNGRTEWQKQCRCECTDITPCTVLDPFTGSGTVAVVSLRHNRHFKGTEINPEYAQIAYERITSDSPLYNTCLLDTDAD